MTSAGLVGDVEATLQGDGLLLQGLGVSRRISTARVAGQWLLAVIGIAGIWAGFEAGWWMLLASPIYSFLLYLALWWTAKPASVLITPGPQTSAALGWVFRWWDLLWLGNLIAALSLFSAASSEGRRTVSFRAPSVDGAAEEARYVLVARDAGDAVALTAGLQGTGASRLHVPVVSN